MMSANFPRRQIEEKLIEAYEIAIDADIDPVKIASMFASVVRNRTQSAATCEKVHTIPFDPNDEPPF